MLAPRKEPHHPAASSIRPSVTEGLKHAATRALWFAPVVLAVIVLRYAIAAI